jgi:hypothetical protein
MKKNIFLMLFAALSWQFALSQNFMSGGLIYDVTSPTTLEVAFQNNATIGSVTIPSQVTYNSTVYLVTKISDSAFSDCSGLTSVTIPNSLISIGEYAFMNCVNLAPITIPNSVTSIGQYAFGNCFALTSITIPNSVTSIADYVFFGSGLTSVTIPNSVTSIGESAFGSCNSLQTITIPNSVSFFGTGAFANCPALISVSCYLEEAQFINDTTFAGLVPQTVSLRVLAGLVPSFEFASYWNDFIISALPSIPTSKVRSNQCGVTLAALNSNINSDIVPNYQAYRFEVTNGSTVNTVVLNRYNFSLTQTPGITYGTTYSVRVAVNIGGVWGAYGVSCNITTPVLTTSVIPTTTVISSFCGITLSAIDTRIGVTPVYAATSYRFEIITGGVTTIYDSPTYNFRLAQAGVAAYGTTYSIRVAALVNGVFANYGASCNVSTPVLTVAMIPTTTIQPSFCGNVLATSNALISAMPVSGATRGRYEITRAGSAPVVYEVAAYSIRLSQTGVVVSNNTSYSIRVAALVGGLWGNYGAPCTVITPPAPFRLRAKSFEVSAYPNPFESAFNLTLETPSKEEVTIAVYDMMGKLIETHQVNPMEVANLQIGNNFAAGIYNVIVSQANEMQAIRLIRK